VKARDAAILLLGASAVTLQSAPPGKIFGAMYERSQHGKHTQFGATGHPESHRAPYSWVQRVYRGNDMRGARFCYQNRCSVPWCGGVRRRGGVVAAMQPHCDSSWCGIEVDATIVIYAVEYYE
jgi:hypothetical protein